jgi:carbon storage regulator
VLVLKRKIGESIIIGDDVEITLLQRDGDMIKIGIEAPKSVRVLRKEIYEEIEQANKSAARHAPDLASLKQLFQRKGGERS